MPAPYYPGSPDWTISPEEQAMRDARARALDPNYDSLKANFAKGDYKAVLATAPDVTARASGPRVE